MRTVRELFDMFDGARGRAFRRFSNQPGQDGFTQGGGSSQDGFTQGGGSSQDGFSQGGGSAQGGSSQGGFPQVGFPQADGPGQGGFPQGGFPQGGGSGQGGFGQSGAPGQGWSNGDDDDYDHYSVEGSGSSSRPNQSFGRAARDFSLGANPLDDIGGAVFGAALGFAGRAIGKRMKKAFEEKVIPAMEARAAQAQQSFEQSKAAEAAIVERYPELRACMKDQVVFLDAGYRTVPVSELTMPITLEQADAVVARLR